MSSGIIKLGTCLKCGKPVYIEHDNGKSNILLQSCVFGGDCEVDILLTPFAIRNKYIIGEI